MFFGSAPTATTSPRRKPRRQPERPTFDQPAFNLFIAPCDASAGDSPRSSSLGLRLPLPGTGAGTGLRSDHYRRAVGECYWRAIPATQTPPRYTNLRPGCAAAATDSQADDSSCSFPSDNQAVCHTRQQAKLLNLHNLRGVWRLREIVFCPLLGSPFPKTEVVRRR